MRFTSMGLSQPVLRAIAGAGYDTPTEIQGRAIPAILEGGDVLGCAQTGTGKTAAFALPIIERLASARPPRGPRRPRALVLAPTRELASQIGDCFAEYGQHTPLRGTVIYGGVGQRPQETALRRGVDVVVATPGRLLDLMNQGLVDFSAVETLVLDEADRMLDMGFIHDIRRIAASLPSERQTLLFSATMPKPIRTLAGELLDDPSEISVARVASTAPRIEQFVHHVPRERKNEALEAMLRENDVRRALVFTRTKHGADKVARRLSKAGVTAEAIHGNKSQGQRQRALESLRSGRSRVLVATDVAARGIDVNDVTHVFNFDLPDEPESYVHRIGRTGRAGAAGIAVALCSKAERPLLKAIERLTGSKVSPLEGMLIVPGPVDHPAAPTDHAAPRKADHAKVTPKRRPSGGEEGERPRKRRQRRVTRAEIGLEPRPWERGHGGNAHRSGGGKPKGKRRRG